MIRKSIRFDRLNLYLTDLSWTDRCACRRQYRTLRIAMYAPQDSPYANNGMYQGCYGLSRTEARQYLVAFYREVSHMTYLSEK